MQQQPIEVVLVKGREKSLLKRHPWVYEKAIARVNGKPGSGGSRPDRGPRQPVPRVGLLVAEVGNPCPMLVVR